MASNSATGGIFNSATASPPWNHVRLFLTSKGIGYLQFGHGFTAVDRHPHRARGRGVGRIFNSATASPPWIQNSGFNWTDCYRIFNSATASPPWTNPLHYPNPLHYR